MKDKVKQFLDDAHKRGYPRKCVVPSKRTGGKCMNKPIKGANVCLVHGGRLPNVRRAAALRLAGLIDPAISVLEKALKIANSSKKAPSATVCKVAQDMLDRNGLKTPDESMGSTVADFGMYNDEELRQLEQFAIKQRLAGSGRDPEGEG